MKIVMYLFGFIVVAAICGVLFVRLAPTDAARWNQPIAGDTNQDLAGGAVRVLSIDEGALARVDAAALALPRTKRIAGSVADGRITYRTRSKWVGFPDFTTVEYADGMLRMFARLRFGRSDFGVNRARLQQLLAAAQAGGE